jgi:hypothetical protein
MPTDPFDFDTDTAEPLPTPSRRRAVRSPGMTPERMVAIMFLVLVPVAIVGTVGYFIWSSWHESEQRAMRELWIEYATQQTLSSFGASDPSDKENNRAIAENRRRMKELDQQSQARFGMPASELVGHLDKKHARQAIDATDEVRDHIYGRPGFRPKWRD